MSIGSTLARGRQRSLDRMVDTFDIKVGTGKPEYNPATKTTEPGYTLLFSTPGYIPPAGGASVLTQSTEVGARTSVSTRSEVRIPWDSDPVPVNAVAFCTAIGDDTPPRMLGKQYRVGGSDGSSQGTACHLEIVEVLS